MRMNTATSVAEYLRAVPPQQRAALQNLRKTIKAAAPGAVEGISYGMPGFKQNGRALVYYAAFAKHCSFFPASKAIIAAHQSDLKNYHTSKGTIQFTVDQPLPATLVKQMVKARIKENEAKV